MIISDWRSLYQNEKAQVGGEVLVHTIGSMTEQKVVGFAPIATGFRS